MKVRPVAVGVGMGAGATHAALGYLALSRLARGRVRRDPLVVPAWARGVGTVHAAPRISVVIPARDEALRIAGVLAPLRAAPGVVEVLVVDDRSTDATAQVARDHGARVIDGAELPEGWIGKPWALQQGLAAATGDVVVFLDADVLPDPALPAAVAELLGDADLASAQLAFAIPDVAQRVLHPALLATLVYRVGPLDTVAPQPAGTAAINGQCFAARREELLGAGGFALVAGISTDDVALARALARAGWRIAVADGNALGSVRMYESAAEAVREWAGRSLALPGASSQTRMLVDLAVVWSVQGRPALRAWRMLWRLSRELPPAGRRARLGVDVLRAAQATRETRAARTVRGGRSARVVARVFRFARAADAPVALPSARAVVLAELVPAVRHAARPLRRTDAIALTIRLALQLALLRTYRRGGRGAGRHGRGYPDALSLLAPLLDPVAAAALTRGTLAPVREWRGRRL